MSCVSARIILAIVVLGMSPFGRCLQFSGDQFVEILHSARLKTGSKQWADAARAWQSVVASNSVNGGYWEKLAEAHFNNGNLKEAILAFEQVLKLGGYCFRAESAYNIARSYASLGEKEQSIIWLQNAFAEGFRDLNQLSRDPM